MHPRVALFFCTFQYNYYYYFFFFLIGNFSIQLFTNLKKKLYNSTK